MKQIQPLRLTSRVQSCIVIQIGTIMNTVNTGCYNSILWILPCNPCALWCQGFNTCIQHTKVIVLYVGAMCWHYTSTHHLCGNFWSNLSQLMYISYFTIYLLKSTSSGLFSQKPISWCIFFAYYINVRNIHQLIIFPKKSQILSKNI